MTNLLEQAINSNDGDHAAKLIQEALGIHGDDVVKLRLSEKLAERPRAARQDHWRMVTD
jgi:hypothetical protein